MDEGNDRWIETEDVEESIEFEYDLEEDEEDEDEEYDDEEEEVEELEEMTSPWVSSWMDADGKIVHGIMVIDDDLKNPKNRCQCYDCSICYQPWTGNGKHQICSLPFGHLYGLSCIKKWLLQSSSSGKCPQCNTFCSYEDVRLIFASRICVADHQKATSTRRFPFTIEGLVEYKHYELLRKVDAMKLWLDEKDQLSNVLKQLDDVKHLLDKLERQWNGMLTRAEKLEERAKELNDAVDARLADTLKRRADALKQRADVWEGHADPLDRRADALDWRADALDRRADALERRLDVLGRRLDACEPNVLFFVEMYIEHNMSLAQKKNKPLIPREISFMLG